MESEFFLNAGIPPPAPAPLMHFNAASTSPTPTWQPLSSAMEMEVNELNCSSVRTPQDCFFNSNWEKSTKHSLLFDSALSLTASNSNSSSQSFMIRELIGKLGDIVNVNNKNHNNSGEISPLSQPLMSAASHIATTGNNSTNPLCYSTPLNSPPKPNLPVMDQSLNIPSLGGNPVVGLNSSVAEFTADPGFAERAARCSRIGSRSFNDRANQLVGVNITEKAYGCNPVMAKCKMLRVSSSPSLKAIGSQKGKQELPNSSQEESSVSEQVPNGETALKISNELNCRKRKAFSRGKTKELGLGANSFKDNENSDAKRCKPNEENGNEKDPSKAEEEEKGSGDEKQNKANSKPPEPPKDYIHVRARRGQATDSHSLAERVRREKISERMKLLQDLVPGCNKVTGKALMLDEIINYVQSLQRQVECLSMKLASVNTRLDFNMDTLISKDVFQSNNTLLHPIFPLDSSAMASFIHQPHQNPASHGNNVSNGTVTQCSVDPLDTALCHNLNMQLPPVHAFTQNVLPQFPTFCEDDLQTIVQMGFGQNPNPDTTLQTQNFCGSNQLPQMKIEF